MSDDRDSAMPTWLSSLPSRGEWLCISDPRRFSHDEEAYDAQYGNIVGTIDAGAGFLSLIRGPDTDVSGPMLEIGCGTGKLSLGLAAASPYPITIVTDPSPSFLRITRNKIEQAGLGNSKLRYALLLGEEVDRLPAESLSSIVMRSTLHHILDVDTFIKNAARALRPGGVLSFEEPCLEGLVLMGAMVQFLPELAKATGKPLGYSQTRLVQNFVKTMSFYARKDLDKSDAEDKHIFRVDELMKTGADYGLAVEFKANMTYESFAGEAAQQDPAFFEHFMRGYLQYCMSWPEDLMERFDKLMPPYCRHVAESSRGGSGPYMHGVFVCRKKHNTFKPD